MVVRGPDANNRIPAGTREAHPQAMFGIVPLNVFKLRDQIRNFDIRMRKMNGKSTKHSTGCSGSWVGTEPLVEVRWETNWFRSFFQAKRSWQCRNHSSSR